MTPEIQTAESTALTKPIETKLALLQQRANSIVVIDQPSYVEARQIELDGKAYIKSVGHELDPGIESAQSHLSLLRNQKTKFVEPAKAIVELAKGKADSWAAEEKRLTKAEEYRKNAEIARQVQAKADEDRREAERIARETRRQRVAEINALLKAGSIAKREAARLLKEAGAEEEAAKVAALVIAEELKDAPPPKVRVTWNVPTVAGIKNQTYYYAELENEHTLIMAFLNSSGERRIFLRQFIQANEQAIGKYARDTKDPKAVEAALPGVRAWSKG